MVASETVALDVVGATFDREIEPGEIVTLSDRGIESRRFVPVADPPAHCVFEHVYFASPSSNVFGQSVLIAGVTDVSFNGTFTILTVPTSTTFTYGQVGAASNSGGGSINATTNASGGNGGSGQGTSSGTAAGAASAAATVSGAQAVTVSGNATGGTGGRGQGHRQDQHEKRRASLDHRILLRCAFYSYGS